MTTPTSGPGSTGGTPSSSGNPPPPSSAPFKVDSSTIMGMPMSNTQVQQFYSTLIQVINSQIQKEQADMIAALDKLNPDKNPDLNG